jgi:hypothetical protein
MRLGIELDFKIMPEKVCQCRPATSIILMAIKVMKLEFLIIRKHTLLYFLRKDNESYELNMTLK